MQRTALYHERPSVDSGQVPNNSLQFHLHYTGQRVSADQQASGFGPQLLSRCKPLYLNFHASQF